MTAPTQLSAVALAQAIRSGEISAEQTTQQYLDAIETRDEAISAYNEVHSDRALETARAIDADIKAGNNPGPLAGVPIAIKDNITVDHGITTCSSKILANFHAPYNATVVERLKAAGAVILGKTNLDEFAMGSSTENSGLGPTRNPWDTSCVPGGSSGGSAAAVSAGLCAAALGSDTGGSIRQPASFCGCVGFKPTYGRISRFGLVAYGSSLDQIGPLTVDVPDAALLTSVIAGSDPHDATCLPNEVPDYLAQLDKPIESLRIGVPAEFFTDALDKSVSDAIHKAIDVYRAAGAKIVKVSLPHSRIDRDSAGALSSFAVACFYIVAMAEASSNLARFDSVHYGHRTEKDVSNIVELYSVSRAEGFGKEVKLRIMLGTYTLSAGYYDAYYDKALRVRRLIKNDFDDAFKSCDVLVSPTAPTTAFALGEKTDDPLAMYLADIYTISVNLAGLPAISVPVGLDEKSLPIGMQLIGPALGDAAVLGAARMYELASGISRLRPVPT
ncbi:MAG TPA: Asp-tRNA(Asn)/Glu-tRNA(Gln) amidotransferase subunit GatA [Phycisphaerae bacterium]|nr:Asp-tRNA(Asn)/Glu-tRNA(Gln) amidotransferase subunit GatA [Phycisphaerae bacterium]